MGPGSRFTWPGRREWSLPPKPQRCSCSTKETLVTGEQTDGRYCLIEMLVPRGGGPPPHDPARHDGRQLWQAAHLRQRLVSMDQ